MGPVLTEDVGGVDLTVDVVEGNALRGDGFSDPMVGQYVVALVELGMGNGTAGDDGFVISKHVGLSFDGNSKVTKRAA